MEETQKLRDSIDKMLSFSSDPSYLPSSQAKKPGRPPKDQRKDSVSINTGESFDLQSILKQILDEVSKLHTKFDRLNEKFDILEQRVNILDSEVTPLKSSVASLTEELSKMQTAVDCLEQDKLAQSVLLSGPSIDSFLSTPNICSENLPAEEKNLKLVQHINREIGSNIELQTIKFWRKFGNSNKSILLKFTDIESKKILRTLSRESERKLYCNDLLTPMRSKLLYELRMMRKLSKNKISVFVRNGTPCVKLSDDTLVYVKSPANLETLKGKI